ncbi:MULTISPECIES: hypothetical protein [unclassified Streptomyces]|uniref:hypothetical protein n=1 Tax=unclassified Streptomyces TaxID=2593676 RepID=UPI002DD99089|nr:hypothetical protein [Streptomyces sp. NBC_01763]WSC35637.1 hypothetical protein OHA08_09070 [Streptomyces sp. NBC_01763]WSF88136.1 hypothetical protein OIE70_36445 [Streptomyces sp. NBC_01744]
MPYTKGQRVEYRNKQGEQAQGLIQRAEGQGQQAKYAVKNEKSMQEELVPESKIERQL